MLANNGTTDIIDLIIVSPSERCPSAATRSGVLLQGPVIISITFLHCFVKAKIEPFNIYASGAIWIRQARANRGNNLL